MYFKPPNRPMEASQPLCCKSTKLTFAENTDHSLRLKVSVPQLLFLHKTTHS